MASIVLVHGAWHGPWCWEQVAGDLQNRGHVVAAVCLPGHDRPGTTKRIWHRIGSYVRAVDEAVGQAGGPPVLVGHSMGGYVVQRYLETAEVASAILVSSVPPRGTLRANLRTLRRHSGPALLAALTADYSHFVRTDALVRQQFFRTETPDEIVASCRDRLQNESAIAINSMVIRRPRPERLTTPVTVVAARDDAIFTLDEQHDLARAHGTARAHVLDGGHDLMLDTSWPALVDLIDAAASSGPAAETAGPP